MVVQQKKLLNWRMKMSKKYKFDDTDQEIQPIPVIITEGKYEGVKIQYGRIAFDENDGNMELNFDYNLMENPNKLEEDQKFISRQMKFRFHKAGEHIYDYKQLGVEFFILLKGKASVLIPKKKLK